MPEDTKHGGGELEDHRRDAPLGGGRGAAGATFDHVAREAGVSRGLLHYHFGTKEKLLAEVVRRDADIRMAAARPGARETPTRRTR